VQIRHKLVRVGGPLSPDDVMRVLAANRPVFHSEADFQQAFAWQLRLLRADAVIRLELRPDPALREAVDMRFTIGGTRVAVEFKYLVRAFEVMIDGEYFRLRDQAAQPLSRYDVLKDIERLERFCASGWADVGYAVVLSNDPPVWSPGRPGSIDEAFRMQGGATLTGTLGWASHAGPGTTRGREKPIVLRGRYPIAWQPYLALHPKCAGQFRFLTVEVGPGPTVTRDGSEGGARQGDPRTSG
jgi:hypothetical protein